MCRFCKKKEEEGMKYDIILCGVGGQGIVSLAAIITNSAAHEGLMVKQVELHGMAQRGGIVVSHLRLSDSEIASDQIPLGTANMILSVEPMESLRYLNYLSAKLGVLITSSSPVKNIVDYPEYDTLLSHINEIPRSCALDAGTLAENAGSHHTINMVMLGAAADSLPLDLETLREKISSRFDGKNHTFIQMNLKAFELGRGSVTIGTD